LAQLIEAQVMRTTYQTMREDPESDAG